MDKFEDFVNVSVRIRPLVDHKSNPCIKVISKNPAVLLHLDRQQSYHFDKIFSDDSEQETVFWESVKPLIARVKEGFNCTVFAYGQTGTGKTYTMGTNPQKSEFQHAGLIPRTLDAFFSDGSDNSDMDISLSFIEIYNEKVFDLLGSDVSTPLPVNGFKVLGTKQERIYSSEEGMKFLEIGGKNRHTGETKQNISSSRSHAIFTIYCTSSRSYGHKTSSKLNLVDLAGCESAKKTGNQGSTFHEGININKGLLCIGQVMTALSHSGVFIPYRQSVVTSILKDSLNRKNYVSLIACVSANIDDSNETAQTLEFSQRVKKIKNKPEVNLIISQYKEHNPILFERASFTPNTKTGLTPFKRPISNIFQTPFANKRQKLTTTLQSIQEPTSSGSTLDSPKSLSSMSLKSIFNADSTQQTLSPMVKKYMAAMEDSLLDKIQTVIENSVRKITASSRRINKENMPRLSWDTGLCEISKVVRSEIRELSAKTAMATSSPIENHISKSARTLQYDSPHPIDEISPVADGDGVFKIPDIPRKKCESLKTYFNAPSKRRSLRLTKKHDTCLRSYYSNMPREERDENVSSPEVMLDEIHSKKTFKDVMLGQYSDTPHLIHKATAIEDDTMNDVFKVPKISARKLKILHNNTASKRRNSGSFEKSNTSLDYSCSNMTCENERSVSSVEVRRTRDLEKQYVQDQIKSKSCSQHVEPKRLSTSPSERRTVLPSVRAEQMFTSPVKRRKSIRLQGKKASLKNYSLQSDFKSPAKKYSPNTADAGALRRSRRISVKFADVNRTEHECVSRPKKPNYEHNLHVEEINRGSPITVRTQNVLDILNRGRRRDIEKLHTVGPKTADRILMFRQIKGPFKSISDLSEMPEWSNKRYKAFLSQNFLRDE